MLLEVDLNWHPKYSYSKLPVEYESREIPAHWKIMLTPVEPKEKGYPHFRNVYFSHVRAKRSKCFITASGWNDSLRIENFYLFNIRAQVKTAGKIVYGKKVRLSEIYLEVEDKSQVRQEYNIDSKIEISYQ